MVQVRQLDRVCLENHESMSQSLRIRSQIDKSKCPKVKNLMIKYNHDENSREQFNTWWIDNCSVLKANGNGTLSNFFLKYEIFLI